MYNYRTTSQTLEDIDQDFLSRVLPRNGKPGQPKSIRATRLA